MSETICNAMPEITGVLCFFGKQELTAAKVFSSFNLLELVKIRGQDLIENEKKVSDSENSR